MRRHLRTLTIFMTVFALITVTFAPVTAFAEPLLGDAIPPGTTTAFDKDSYSVTAGEELTIVTSTTFPDLSSVDSSIYEDGKITLDKPFASDVDFTLKYGGVAIGACTLEAGDTSVWVSELSGATPRQPLSALSNNTDEFSVVAAIPAGESSKAIEVTIEALAVNQTGEDVIQVLASDTAAVKVTSYLESTIAEGSTTVLDSETYPVKPGGKLTMSATTQFPNMSGADASIYEDGLVKMDKAFDHDVTLSLKYNGTPIGSYTLAAGDKSFWVSEFSGMMPRQRLNVFTTGSANTITIEATIPVTESVKTMAVTISAVTATTGNFDNESDWTKVLASDTATITVNPLEHSVYALSTGTVPTGLRVGQEANVNVTLAATEEKDLGYSNVRVNVAVDKTGAHLLATDTLGHEYDVAVVGYWGPTGGFPITNDFTVTTPFKCSFDAAGTYKVTLSLADMADGGKEITSKEITITIDPEQDHSFALETSDVNATAAETATEIGTVSAQAAGTTFDLKTGTLYAISGKATNMTSGALGGTRISTITVNSAVAPSSENFKVFIWLERTGNWMPLILAFEPAGTNTYSAPMNGALNYGDPLAAGAATDGPFAFRADNASTITVQSVIKDGETVLSNELVQTITVNPDEGRSFALETADVNATAAGTATDIGTVSAKAAGTSFTVKAGTLNAISGKATNMTNGALGGTRVSTITVNSAVAPSSDNFKVYIWLERTGNWMPKTLAWESAGTNTYSAAMNGALNYGDPLAARAATDGPFAFKVDNASTITVQSVIKNGETVLSNELVQTITVNPLEHSVYTLSTGTVPTGLVAGREADVNVTLAATDIKDIGYDKALVKVEVDKPGAHLYATDTEGDRFDAAEVGYWGPAGGFPISKSYSATTPFTCSFDAAGTYKVTLSLVDMADNEKVIASKEITIDVATLASTIAEGSTTVLDSETYPVKPGGKLTMSATTQFPNMSGADASIYEDGLVTLDKPFDNDVTLSLKYNGTPIGSYTLTAGDKSFWVSQFANMTPRQRLNVFISGAANTITIETTIPADESVKTMAVTISAVAATEGNFDNESNWTKVLASDTATITVNPLEHSVYTLSTGTVPTGLVAGHEANVNVTLAATDIKDIGYDKALVKVEVDKPGAHLYATDTEGDRFDAAEVGYWGPAGGFPISKNYSATTPFTCSFDAAGTYKVTLSLVDMADNEKVIASKEITIDVATLASTIAEGSTTVLDSDTYTVVVGEKLTMSATTQFPNMSGADASIYEDGLVALDKPFDNDVTLSLKYNGTPIGSYTLTAGDKSFWVSQFANMTPRQKLNVFTTGAANTITIEATIPVTERAKTVAVTISAVTATEGNFDNESNWTKVLASDTASVTISPVTLVASIALSGPTKMNPNTSATLTASVSPANATNKAVTWSSSNTSVATVDNGVVAALKTGTVIITATAADGSGKKGTRTITVTTVKLVTGITVSGTPEVGIGKTITLRASVTPTNAASRTVTWSSLNTSIATVDTYGKVTGKAAGQATIRATAADGSAIYGEYAVTVKPAATKVTISGAKIIDLALADKAIQLAATVSPTGASQLVTWYSSSTSYATVDQNGKVTGIRAGTVTITAKAKDGSGRYATYTVTVSTLVNSVTIGGPNEVATGKTIQLTCSVLPTNATNKSVTWSIPAEYSAFAAVSSTGLVTAKTVTADTHITVIATAKDNNKVASQPYDITVKAVAASQVDIYKDTSKVSGTTQNVDMFAGATLQLSALVTPDTASQHVVWSTSSVTYAAVDAAGLVTFKKGGTVTITATAADGSLKKASVTFKVFTLVHNITIGGPNAVAQGKKIQLTTSFNAGNFAPTNKAVTWKSSDSTIATVSAYGIVTAAIFKATDPDEKTLTITATAQDGTNVNDTYDITIKKNGAASVDITYGAGESAVSVKGRTVAADLTMKDMGIAFAATVSPGDKASQGVAWSSSNTKVVTVVNGVVKVVGKGTAVITVTATDGTGVKATFTITVVDKVVTPLR